MFDMNMLIISFLFAILILVFYYWKEEQEYKKTEYYNQTKNSYIAVNSNKGISGEYSTWESLKDIPGYKKSVFNCYVPKRKNETTEIDLILLYSTSF